MMANEWILIPIFHLVVSIGIFAFLVYVGKYFVNKDKSMFRFKDSKLLNPQEYFPTEEILSLKQVFYLVMILVFILICLYLFFDWTEGMYFIFLLDIVVSVYLAVNRSVGSLKENIIFLLLVPFGSITGVLFGHSVVVLLDIFHIFGYLYFIKFYYRKFVEYTENNGLGITVMLLFAIILVSFLFTVLVEGVTPIDSMTMVSNAFTSNSFYASGKIMIGKVNSLILAWGGFILSGVGTATLAVSIVNEYVNKQFDELKDLIKEKKEDN